MNNDPNSYVSNKYILKLQEYEKKAHNTDFRKITPLLAEFFYIFKTLRSRKN